MNALPACPLSLLAVSSFATLRDSFDGDSLTSADAAKAATAGGTLLVARGAALGGGYVLLDKRLEAGKKECLRLGIDYSDLYVQASDIPAQIPWWNAYAGPFKMAEVGETKLSSSATWGRMRSRLKEHAYREACVAQGVQCDDVDQSFSKDENKRWVEMRRRLQVAGKEEPDFSTNGLF